MSGLSTRPSRHPARSRPGLWRRLALLAVVALVSALGIGSAAAQPQPTAGQAPPVTNPTERAADLARPAVVWIRVHYDAWVLTGAFGTFRESLDFGCSGFVVNPAGYVVTAGHCVDPGPEGAQGAAVERVVDRLVEQGTVPYYFRDQLIEDVLVGNLEWQVEGRLDESRPDRQVFVTVGGGNVRWGKPGAGARRARVVQEPTKDQGDLALLKVDQKGLPSILLSQNDDIEIGEELLSIGYPAGSASDDESFGLTNRNGQINAEVNKGSSGLPYYETSARLTGGMSGGPAVNLAAEVVGVASAKDEDANYIVPASMIQEMLASKGVRNQLGRLDELYRQGLESYYRHEYSAAIQRFDQVLALMSGHRLARAKKAKAAELRERFGDPRPPAPPDKPGRSTRELLLAAGAVLVVLAVIVGLVLRSRAGKRRRAPSPEPFAGPQGWGVALPPNALDRDASEAGMAGRMQREDADPTGTMHAEPALRGPQPTRSEVLHDPSAADGSVRDGLRGTTSVSVWDPEPVPDSEPDAEAAGPTRNFCFNCGSRVLPDDRSCGRCGATLG